LVVIQLSILTANLSDAVQFTDPSIPWPLWVSSEQLLTFSLSAQKHWELHMPANGQSLVFAACCAASALGGTGLWPQQHGGGD
jgi:hypothetical protein